LDRAHLAAFAVALVVWAIASYWPQLHDRLGWTEGQIGAVCLGSIIVFQLIMAPYWAYREAADFIPSGSGIRPDMRIDQVLDYIVNDSITKLQQPGPPQILQHGRAAGATLIQRGVELEDARRLVNNELISGHLRSWGKRQILTYQPIQFENVTREIDRSYWDNMRLHPYACLYNVDNAAQTDIWPRRTASYHWAGLMLSRIQVQQIWRRKSMSRRLIDKIKRRRRIQA
jgi:hypothetical protein